MRLPFTFNDLQLAVDRHLRHTRGGGGTHLYSRQPESPTQRITTFHIAIFRNLEPQTFWVSSSILWGSNRVWLVLEDHRTFAGCSHRLECEVAPAARSAIHRTPIDHSAQ